jgi:hypothetical protein
MAVVDHRLWLAGLDRLRIIDASLMQATTLPTIVEFSAPPCAEMPGNIGVSVSGPATGTNDRVPGAIATGVSAKNLQNEKTKPSATEEPRHVELSAPEPADWRLFAFAARARRCKLGLMYKLHSGPTGRAQQIHASFDLLDDERLDACMAEALARLRRVGLSHLTSVSKSSAGN